MQNEMRDRLIELVKKVPYGVSVGATFERHFCEKVADHLIANGVILPPCKAGDTVYVITTKIPCYACISCTDFCHKKCLYPNRGKLAVKTATVRSIEIGEICKIHVEIEEGKVTHSYDYTYWFDDIGKTVFLTREEAEKKLEEHKNEK